MNNPNQQVNIPIPPNNNNNNNNPNNNPPVNLPDPLFPPGENLLRDAGFSGLLLRTFERHPGFGAGWQPSTIRFTLANPPNSHIDFFIREGAPDPGNAQVNDDFESVWLNTPIGRAPLRADSPDAIHLYASLQNAWASNNPVVRQQFVYQPLPIGGGYRRKSRNNRKKSKSKKNRKSLRKNRKVSRKH